MHARSNSVQADPTAMDRLVGYVRDEVMPMFRGMPGHVGLSMLADRDSGRCIVTSAWESEEAMRASEDRAAVSRREAMAMSGADAPRVEEWEVAVMHRVHAAHDGAGARVLWGEVAADRVDDATSTFRTAMVPRLEELPGFCSVSVLVDRTSGRCVQTATYDSREDMRRAGELIGPRREEFLRDMGITLTDVAEFDLVIHELRIPEMA